MTYNKVMTAGKWNNPFPPANYLPFAKALIAKNPKISDNDALVAFEAECVRTGYRGTSESFLARLQSLRPVEKAVAAKA
jgi:hypothetical protein